MRELLIHTKMRELISEGWDGYAALAWATKEADQLLADFAAGMAKAAAVLAELADTLRVAVANSTSQLAELFRVGWWSIHGGPGLSRAEAARRRRTENLLRLRERRALRRHRRDTAWQRNHRLA